MQGRKLIKVNNVKAKPYNVGYRISFRSKSPLIPYDI